MIRCQVTSNSMKKCPLSARTCLWATLACCSLVLGLLCFYAYLTTDTQPYAANLWLVVLTYAFLFCLSSFGAYRQLGPLVSMPTLMAVISAAMVTNDHPAKQMLGFLCIGVLLGLMLDILGTLDRRKKADSKR